MSKKNHSVLFSNSRIFTEMTNKFHGASPVISAIIRYGSRTTAYSYHHFGVNIC